MLGIKCSTKGTEKRTLGWKTPAAEQKKKNKEQEEEISKRKEKGDVHH